MREDHRKFDGSNHLAFLIFSKRVGFKFLQHKKKERVRQRDREMEGGRHEGKWEERRKETVTT